MMMRMLFFLFILIVLFMLFILHLVGVSVAFDRVSDDALAILLLLWLVGMMMIIAIQHSFV